MRERHPTHPSRLTHGGRRNDARLSTPGRPALLVAACALALASAVGPLAFAQPRGRAPSAAHKPKPPPEPVEDGGASTTQAPSAASSPSAAAPDGPIPPPSGELAGDGGRLSPLNPAANEFSDAGPAANPVDYDRLLADIAALRARVAAVSDTLFHSRIGISIQTEGDHGRIAALSVSLDDGVVWTAPATMRVTDMTNVFDHAVAPGHHAVTVDVERRDDRNDAFRTTQRSRFVVDVPADQKLNVELRVSDDSDMGGSFPGDHRGQYDLRIRARAQAQAQAGGR